MVAGVRYLTMGRKVHAKPPGVRDVPDGFEQIAEASKGLMEARRRALAAQFDIAEAEARVRALVESGQCSPGCPHDDPLNDRIIDNPLVSTLVRLAFLLLADPMLNYHGAAARIWGPGLTLDVAKNRISSLIAQLRKLGVVESRGSNVFLIDREALEKFTGMNLSSMPAEPLTSHALLSSLPQIAARLPKKKR